MLAFMQQSSNKEGLIDTVLQAVTDIVTENSDLYQGLCHLLPSYRLCRALYT